MKAFTIILASALALVNAAPATVDRSDPCATLSRLPLGNTTYAAVSSCYNSIEYDPTLAKATITNMRTLYNDFFVFRDTALTPNLALPFTSAPVDVLARLTEIENKAYTTDFAFHRDLQALAKSVNDAHVNYTPFCYSTYVFQIDYSFYSPIVDGKQAIRVYRDSSARGHEDCEVVTINGQNAYTFIQAWADKNTGYSKDAGVRFNYAMSNQEYSPEHWAWTDRTGSFSLRSALPDGPTLDLQLNCGYNGMVTSSLNWVVKSGPAQGTYSNKATYLNKFCYDHLDEPEPEAIAAAPNTHTNPLEEPSNLFLYKREVRRRQHLERRSEPVAGPTVMTPIVKSQPETKPGRIWHYKRDEEVKDAGGRHRRYKRDEETKPSGRIWHYKRDEEVKDARGRHRRYKRDEETKPSGRIWHFKRDEEVKDAGGRHRRYKRELERLAAPAAVPDTSSLDLDDATFVAHGNQTAVYQLKSKPHIGVLVVPSMSVPVPHEVPAIQRMLTLLAERNVTHLILDFTNNGGGYVAFASELTNIFFPTQDKTINSHLFRLRVTPSIAALASADLANNRTDTYWEPSRYTDKATDKPFTTNYFLDPVVITLNQHSAQFTQEVYFDYNSYVNPQITHPWTNDASKITILTDGQCGSACGMTADHFASRHGVKAVAVGGVRGSGLSMFSFAGASVLALKDIVSSYEQLKLAAPLARLPYRGSFRVGVAEAYSGTDTTTLEYNPDRYGAAYRLDYTPETARSQDKLWGAVSATAWA